jgi:hypothetical protein
VCPDSVQSVLDEYSRVSGRRLDGVQAFEVCDVNGVPYTAEDLRNAERNFADFRHVIEPPFVVGHEEDQPLNNTGYPSFGWVDRLDFAVLPDRTGKDRPCLTTGIADVHDGIARLIDEKRYKKVSAEMWRRPPAGAFTDRADILDALRRRDLDPDAALTEAQQWAPAEHARLAALHEAGKLKELPTRDWLVDFRLRDKLGAMFRRLAALGGELPRLSRLTDLPQTTFSDKPPGKARDARLVSGDEEYEVFMATDTEEADAGTDTGVNAKKARLIDSLSKLKFPDEVVNALASMPHERLQSVVLPLLEQAAGVHDEATGETAPETPAEPPPDEVTPPDPETMIQDLVALGEDETALRAMSPEELAALWQEKKGTAMSHRTPAPARKPAAPADAFAALKAEIDELKRTVLLSRQDAQAVKRDVGAERKKRMRERMEEALQRGRKVHLTHSDVDPASKTFNVRKQMEAAIERVAKFGDSAAAEFDGLISYHEEKARTFSGRRGEQIPDRQQQDATDPHALRVKKHYEERRARLQRA